MGGNMDKGKKKIRINRWFWFMIVSFVLVWFMYKEAMGAFLLHRSYKAGLVYGDNTYVLDTSKGGDLTYADIRATGIDISKVTLMRGRGGSYTKYDIKTEGEPKDSMTFSSEEMWARYFFDVIATKYNDHMYYMFDIGDISTTLGTGYGYIFGSDALLKEGQMCKAKDEVVCIKGHSVGDSVTMNGHTYKVTGILKADMTVPVRIPDDPADYYDSYKRREKSDILYRVTDISDTGSFDLEDVCPSLIVLDDSALSVEDRILLGKFGEFMPLADKYGSFATGYAYMYLVLPVIAGILSIIMICRYIRSYKA